MIFPPDFLWGTAVSSHQVEGHNSNNDWWAWEQENGRIPVSYTHLTLPTSDLV